MDADAPRPAGLACTMGPPAPPREERVSAAPLGELNKFEPRGCPGRRRCAVHGSAHLRARVCADAPRAVVAGLVRDV